MPTYDYHCDACDHDFEEMQSFSEAPLTKCPKCGKKKLRRLFGTGAGVIFKGSGFYQTDYRDASYNEAAKADKEKSASSAGDGKSSDTTKSVDKKDDTSGKTGTKSDSGGSTKAKQGGKSSKSRSAKADE